MFGYSLHASVKTRSCDEREGGKKILCPEFLDFVD